MRAIQPHGLGHAGWRRGSSSSRGQWALEQNERENRTASEKRLFESRAGWTNGGIVLKGITMPSDMHQIDRHGQWGPRQAEMIGKSSGRRIEWQNEREGKEVCGLAVSLSRDSRDSRDRLVVLDDPNLVTIG